MARRKQENSTIKQIAQLVHPLSRAEHDRIVDEIRLHWELLAAILSCQIGVPAALSH